MSIIYTITVKYKYNDEFSDESYSFTKYAEFRKAMDALFDIKYGDTKSNIDNYSFTVSQTTMTCENMLHGLRVADIIK